MTYEVAIVVSVALGWSRYSIWNLGAHGVVAATGVASMLLGKKLGKTAKQQRESGGSDADVNKLRSAVKTEAR